MSMKTKWTKLIVIVLVGLMLSTAYAATLMYKSWGSATVIFETDAYGGSAPDVNDNAVELSSEVDMVTNGYIGAHCTLEYTSSGTTDDLILYVYSSANGTDYDDTALTTVCADAIAADTQMSFILKDIAYWKVGLTSAAGTDTHDAQVTYRPWRMTTD